MTSKIFLILTYVVVLASLIIGSTAHLFISDYDEEEGDNMFVESASCPPAAEVPSTNPITPITKANYAFAETEVILADYVLKSAGVGILRHLKDAMDPEDRTILRPNFDTLYSFAVLDLLESPATIVMPQTDRFQILQVVNQEHWTPLIADMPGRYELTHESMGSRYVFALVRTRVNMQDSSDMKAASAVQDQTLIEQAQKGDFVASTQYDMDAILALRADYQKRMQLEGVTSELI
jgi:hypothetical protein